MKRLICHRPSHDMQMVLYRPTPWGFANLYNSVQNSRWWWVRNTPCHRALSDARLPKVFMIGGDASCKESINMSRKVSLCPRDRWWMIMQANLDNLNTLREHRSLQNLCPGSVFSIHVEPFPTYQVPGYKKNPERSVSSRIAMIRGWQIHNYLNSLSLRVSAMLRYDFKFHGTRTHWPMRYKPFKSWYAYTYRASHEDARQNAARKRMTTRDCSTQVRPYVANHGLMPLEQLTFEGFANQHCVGLCSGYSGKIREFIDWTDFLFL